MELNLKHPYRELATPSPKKKKFCFLFHDWFINLKTEVYDAILRDSRVINNKRIYYVDPFELCNMKCRQCGKEKEMPGNPVFIQLAMELFKI